MLFVPLILSALTVVIFYDILGALLSKLLGFEYVWWSFGSFIIYGLFSFHLNNLYGIVITLTSIFFLGIFDSAAGIYIGKKFKAVIREKDKKHLRINLTSLIQMGIITVIIGLLTILIF